MRQIARQHDASNVRARGGHLLVAVRRPRQRHHRSVLGSTQSARRHRVALHQAAHRDAHDDGIEPAAVTPRDIRRGAEHRRDEPGELEGHAGANDGFGVLFADVGR